ncbi:hypothetical protein B0H17DRAFT_1032178 [Mycena rosella]|uniref:HMG box domain-containing protein n=1 Tax=Mycena rosella TaxID=1033263 RepID=A0AAD7MAP6_MYCRO|nr:hypothetical protein B0H17DRAFT_1032178 [Mycena rosella]
MHYHTASNSDDDDHYAIFQKIDSDQEEDPHASLTSQTLNADGTPKRPMNAFMIFARRRRPQVSAENQSMRTGDISKILSQEWKAMLPSDKEFYQTQARLLKESFNTKYPDYVYRRRPNNTRKRRKPEGAAAASVSSGRASADTDDAESSPDGEDAPPLPLPLDRYQNGYLGGGGSGSAYYPAGSYSGGGYANGHARTHSYPYPQAQGSSERYAPDAPAPRLLSSPYYPPYDSPPLRKAHSVSSMHGNGSHGSSASASASPPAAYASPPAPASSSYYPQSQSQHPAPAPSHSPANGYYPNSPAYAASYAASTSPGYSPRALYAPSPSPHSHYSSSASSATAYSAAGSPGYSAAGSPGYAAGAGYAPLSVPVAHGGGGGGYWRPDKL